MENFNFNMPIDATVIFDDSDDETSIDDLYIREEATNNNSPNNINESKPEKDHNRLSNATPILEEVIRNNTSRAETFESINVSQNNSRTTRCEAPINNIEKTETLNNNKSKPLDMPTLQVKNSALQCFYESFNKQHNTDYYDTNPDNQRKNKRKPSTDEKKTPKKRRTSKCEPDNNAESVEVQEHNTVSTEMNKDVLQDYNLANTNTETVLTKSLQQNDQAREPFTISIEINQDQIVQGIPQGLNQQQLNKNILLDQPLNEPINSVTNIHKELLTALSEHMISIINSYVSYMRIYRTNTEQSLIKLAYNNFIRTKQHFFELAYNTVETIIIPRENDTTYVKNFIDNTVKLASLKSYTCNSHIKPLFVEMLVWVKKKREQIRKMQLNTTPRSCLLEQLQKPLTLYPPQYPKRGEQIYKKATDRTPITSYGSSGRNKDNDLSFLNKLNAQTQPCCPGVTLSQNSRQYNANQRWNKPNAHKQPCCPAVTMSEYARQYNADQTLYKQNVQNQPCPVEMPQQDILQYNYYNNQIYITQPNQNTSYGLNNNLQAIQNQQNSLQDLPSSSEILTTTSSCSKQTTQTWQTTQSWEKDVPTPQNFLSNYEELQVLLNNHNVRPENPAPIELNRSSISRDSGFISPLNFNNRSDPMYIYQEEQRLKTTPLITHVTSLNPNVSYISDGSCTVCGKTTKKKCLGCYKCYYCSHGCQTLDWRKHQTSCK